jgi:hypothetical protein
MSAKSWLILPLALISCSSPLIACSAQTALRVLEQKFEVSEFTADVAQSSASVTAVVINRGWLPADNIVVMVHFYDDQGNMVGTYAASHDQLQPDQVWNFKVEMKGQDAWKVVRYDMSVANK